MYIVETDQLTLVNLFEVFSVHRDLGTVGELHGRHALRARIGEGYHSQGIILRVNLILILLIVFLRTRRVRRDRYYLFFYFVLILIIYLINFICYLSIVLSLTTNYYE